MRTQNAFTWRQFYQRTVWFAGSVRRSCERRYHDPVRVQMGLASLQAAYENGDIDQDRFHAEEIKLMARLKTIWERRSKREQVHELSF